MTTPRVCLTMIVKDEERVVQRCVRSTLPLIDCWSILDTGSTDATEECVRSALGHLPGSFHHSSWKGFGASRTEAFALAKASQHLGPEDWSLVIDADDTLVIDPSVIEKVRARLAGPHDMFQLTIELNGLHYARSQLFRHSKAWRYEGVLHEYAT